MCEFCTQHGEGEKWYLTMKNYSRELLNEKGRREYTAEFLNGFHARVPKSIEQLDAIRKTPWMRLARPMLIRAQKQNHYGQVAPMEDVEKIFELVHGAVRLPCVCRRVTTGNMNARYCYGLTMDRELMDALDDSFSLETLTKDEALESIRKLDREGLVHSVWTFKTPFIGGLCNCDQDCMAYRITHARKDYPVMFRAEWVGMVSMEACNGCRLCMRQCQYGAIRYSSNHKKVTIDPTACYGCGVCRAVCKKDAIVLQPREMVREAAGMW
ncbi:MAG: 4Fe-4S binding protein [Chloroflexi bacterium]|nr:4Fe-4S binding protein [Chloroflexota bacterium]